MKKNNNLLIIIVLIISTFSLTIIAKADSGWDNSYDSIDIGGSWDSGSSWDYGSSGSGYYSSSNFDGEFNIVDIIIIIVVFSVIMIYCIKNAEKMSKTSTKTFENTVPINTNYEDISIDKIKEILPEFDIDKFKNEAFEIYKNIQVAWSDFDTETIRKYTTDELYNMYSSQLKTLKLKKQQNIMKNIEYVDCKIIDIKEEKNIVTINVYLNVYCLDYIINTTTKETLRGSDNTRLDVKYILTFIKSNENNNTSIKCPNCGASVDINSSATCPYCDSVLVKDSTNYVLSKKQNIKQDFK